MRQKCLTLEDYCSFNQAKLTTRLKQLDKFDDVTSKNEPDCDLFPRLYELEYTRLLLIANDHADILGRSYLMEVVGVIYDRAIFLTDVEYRSAHGKKICVQAAVEVPFIILLSMSGSTDEEQLRVVPDRAEDLHSVSTPLCQEVGDPLCDRLVGFTGDLQTRWME